MEKELDCIVSCMNQDYQYQRISFSGLVLKKTSPSILLIQDHIKREINEPLYQYPDFVSEIENVLRRCFIDVRGKMESEEPTEIFISKAQLYSPYHYLVTFL